jgi:GR25 family glycosyltransferase involved in LPS biosynthesis
MIANLTDYTLIPVYVINLKESVSRREHMVREMGNAEIPFTFFEAVSSRDVTQTIGAVTRNQTACSLSHLHALKLIAEGEHEFGAVFEDDLVISPEARMFLQERTLQALPRFDIMQLCNLHRRPRSKPMLE